MWKLRYEPISYVLVDVWSLIHRMRMLNCWALMPTHTDTSSSALTRYENVTWKWTAEATDSWNWWAGPSSHRRCVVIMMICSCDWTVVMMLKGLTCIQEIKTAVLKFGWKKSVDLDLRKKKQWIGNILLKAAFPLDCIYGVVDSFYSCCLISDNVLPETEISFISTIKPGQYPVELSPLT